MRPLKIEMQAFGPYASVARVDFERLGGHRLFLVHGATGAGKSTILDAICFALYGETSGREREARQMRCDAAAPDLETSVTLDFAIGDRRYRIQRSPDQEIAKQRGVGLRKVQHAATLSDRTHIPSDDDEGEVLEFKVRQVDAKVAELIGFDAAEFRQVVLLPQGRFRELLSADSGQRQKILQTLFQTVLFKRIEDTLREQAAKTTEEMKDIRRNEEATLTAANAETRDALVSRRSRHESAFEELRTTVERFIAADRDAGNALEGAKRMAKAHDNLAAARERLAGLRRQEAKIRSDEMALKRARAARSVQPAETKRNTCRDTAARTQEKLREHKRALEAATKKSREAETALEREQARDPLRDAARNNMEKLAAMTKKVESIAKFSADCSALAEDVAKSVRDRDACKEALASIKRNIPKCEGEVEQLQGLSAQLKPREAVREEAERRRKKRNELKGCEADLRDLKLNEATTKALHSGIGAKLEAAESRLARVRTEMLRHHASLLVQDLAAGKPCPVCGSKDHPKPASAHGKAGLPDRALEIESEIASMKAEEKKREKELREASVATARVRERLDGIKEALGETHTLPIARFEADLREAQRSCAEAKGASERLPATRKSLEGARKSQQHTEIELEKFDKAGQELQKALAKAEERMMQAERDVPEDLRTVTALERAQRRAGNLLEELVTASKMSESKSKQAKEAQREAEGKHEAETVNASEHAKQQEAAEAELASALKKYGFSDEKDYAAAKLSGTEIKEIEDGISKYDRERSVAAADVSRLEAEVGENPRPNVKPLEATAAEVAAELAKCRDDIAETRIALTNDTNSLRTLQKLEKDLKRLDERYGVEGRIADVAIGRNERNISFERYVLGAFLQEGLAAANERLRIMSEGRYELHRSADVSHGSRAAGLDLNVLDSYSGEYRSVKTLSGGEGFLAALSLALGLSDVVQGYSGGIRMEALFIDEGFDSLDPEALDRAIQALIKLQVGGRLVGVISHVEELRERIPARIEIASSRSGSSIRMHV